MELCGTDRILLQPSQLSMQILYIYAQIPKIIKTTDIEMVGARLHVLSLQGGILVTFQYHRICVPNVLGSDITSAQDIVIYV
jgi:hypothetical protein